MMTPIDSTLPFPRSYWAVAGKVLAGCYPGDREPTVAGQKVEGLARCGVTHVVNLMHPFECDNAGCAFSDYADLLSDALARDGRQLVFARHPIVDMGTPSVPEMRAILDTIDAGTTAGGITFVHCWGGRGRTGTVIGCYLVRHGFVDREDALDRLAELTSHWAPEWGPTPETVEQRRFVRAWRAGQ